MAKVWRSERSIEQRRQYALAYYHRNREHQMAVAKLRYQTRPEKIRAWHRADYASNPNKYRRWQLWSAYRLRPKQFQELLKKQGGRCPCGRKFVTDVRNKKDSPHVDHDHKCCPGVKSCGECVRGLLCRNCNRALGLLHDDAHLLRVLAEWIEVSPSRK